MSYATFYSENRFNPPEDLNLYFDQFSKRVGGIESYAVKIEFVQQFFQDNQWMRDQPKFCKKIAKCILKQDIEGCISDSVILTIVDLLGRSYEKFFGKLLPKAASAGITMSCAHLIEMGVIQKLPKDMPEDENLSSLIFMAAKINSTELLDWIKSNHSNYLKIFFLNTRELVYLLREIGRSGSISVFEWLAKEDSQAISQQLINESFSCFDSFYHHLIEHKQLPILQWVALTYPEAFRQFLFDPDSIFRNAVLNSFLPFCEWLYQDYLEDLKRLMEEKIFSPSTVELFCSSSEMFEWILEHFPHLVDQMIKDERCRPLSLAARSDSVEFGIN